MREQISMDFLHPEQVCFNVKDGYKYKSGYRYGYDYTQIRSGGNVFVTTE